MAMPSAKNRALRLRQDRRSRHGGGAEAPDPDPKEDFWEFSAASLDINKIMRIEKD